MTFNKPPIWFWVAISIGLLMNLMLLSVIGMVVQQLYWWFGMDLLNTLNGADWIWPIITPVIPLMMLWIGSKSKNWLL